MLFIFVNILMVRKMIRIGIFSCDENEFNRILLVIRMEFKINRLIIVVVFNVLYFLIYMILYYLILI